MKKIVLSFLLIGLLFVGCDAPAEDAAEPLPTLVPTIVVSEAEVTNVQAEDAPLPEAEPAAEEALEGSDEATGVSSGETAVTTENNQSDMNMVNLDDFLLYDEPSGIDYRTTLEFSLAVDGDTTGAVFAEGRRTVAPNASTMTFNMSGTAGGGLGETMTVAQIEDAFYAVLPPNDCFSLAGQSGFENPFDLFLDTGGFLTEDAQRVLPDEMINGIDSYHYALSRENLLSWEVYEIYEADLYVAKDGGYVTRLLISGFGVNDVLNGDSGQEGEIYYVLNFIPEPVAPITVPPGCTEATALTTEFPVLDDATAVQSAPGLFSYETQVSFEDVIAFYKETLTANNEWSIAQEIVQAPNATITFTGAGGTLMVNLGPGPNGGTLVGLLLMP